jgi:type IX secretion system PorP/SprF family membrane protein
MMKKLIQIILVLSLPILGIAQQQPQFTQYMYNTISINPAYAGSREFMVINLLNRNQWVGVSGAPITQTLSVHTSIPSTKLGIGLSVINDELAYERTTYLATDVSYTIKLNEDYQLAFGLKVGASKYTLDNDILNDPEYNDDPFLDYLNYKWTPNIGAGVYFRAESIYFGLSAPRLVNYAENSNLEYISLDRISYYFNGGYLMDLNPQMKFKPTFLVKYTNGAPLSVDISASFLYREKLWLSGFYRFNESFGALANFKVSDSMSIGYSYDYIVTDLNPYTIGSHELILTYELPFPRPSCKCKDLYN